MAIRLRAAAVGGPLAVIVAAALWGTDALFRLPLSTEHPAATIVFCEHIVLVVCLSPFLLGTARSVGRAGWRVWLAVLGIGAGASTLATVLFTQAFTYGDPVTPLLLQKLQPLFAVAAAWVLLGERPRRAYALLLVGGVAGAYLLAFGDPLSVAVRQLVPALLAIGAAALWAMGTVLGRYVSGWLTSREVLTARAAVGLPTSGIMVAVLGVPAIVPLGDTPGVIGLALVPGLIALAIYYRGLRRIPAMVATLGELAFPLTAAVIGRLVFGIVLTPSQWAGLVLLVVTIVLLARPFRRQRQEDRELVLTAS